MEWKYFTLMRIYLHLMEATLGGRFSVEIVKNRRWEDFISNIKLNVNQMLRLERKYV